MTDHLRSRARLEDTHQVRACKWAGMTPRLARQVPDNARSLYVQAERALPLSWSREHLRF
jgi:hypothetical protein